MCLILLAYSVCTGLYFHTQAGRILNIFPTKPHKHSVHLISIPYEMQPVYCDANFLAYFICC
jgi:hypothetical protein